MLIQELKHKEHIKNSRKSLAQGIKFGSSFWLCRAKKNDHIMKKKT